MTLNITIPANTTATIYVPVAAAGAVTESGLPAASALGAKFLRMETGAAVYEVGSGAWEFASETP